MKDTLKQFYDYLSRRELLVLDGDNPIKTFDEVYADYTAPIDMREGEVIEVSGKKFTIEPAPTGSMCIGCHFAYGITDFCDTGSCAKHDYNFILKEVKP